MPTLQHIQAMIDQLAESEGKVAKTILEDPHLLEHYTITSLAQHAGTSTSAVLRFCHSLGYAGFKDFRYELVSELQKDAGAGSDTQDPIRRAAEGISAAITALAEIDRATLGELASQLANASRVFCMGLHRSALPATKLRMDLEDLGILAFSAGSTTEATHLANLVDTQSCVVLFSESGTQTSFRPALDAGFGSPTHSWVVTSNPRPQLAQLVEHTIVLPSAKRNGAGSVDEHPVAMAFVELLTLTTRGLLS